MHLRAKTDSSVASEIMSLEICLFALLPPPKAPANEEIRVFLLLEDVFVEVSLEEGVGGACIVVDDGDTVGKTLTAVGGESSDVSFVPAQKLLIVSIIEEDKLFDGSVVLSSTTTGAVLIDNDCQ